MKQKKKIIQSLKHYKNLNQDRKNSTLRFKYFTSETVMFATFTAPSGFKHTPEEVGKGSPADFGLVL